MSKKNHTRASRRPSPGLIVGSVALIVALGGTAFALPGKKKIDKNDLRRGVVKAKNIQSQAVKASKLRNQAVTSAKLRNLAVTTPKLGNDTVTKAKLAPTATPPVVAYGHVADPLGAGDPALQNPVGLTSVVEHLAGADGATRVIVNPSVLPGATLARCAVTATLTDDADPSGALGVPGFVNVATGGGLAANHIQVQTRDETAGLADRSYFIEVSCPGT